VVAQRVIGIGDIHGNHDALCRLLDIIQPNFDFDILVFLGDYIDRGKSSKKTIEFVSDLYDKHPHNVVLLFGNHELMAHAALQSQIGSKEDRMWKNNGGTETIKNYHDLNAAKESFEVFLSKLRYFWQFDKNIFVHAGFPRNGRIPDVHNLSEDDIDCMFWRRCLDRYDGDNSFIVGHTPHRCVTKHDNIIVVDTGAYKTEILSGYDVVNNTVYQSNGEVYTLYQQETWKR
jgi:serine/threonine protein phosphatase 1